MTTYSDLESACNVLIKCFYFDRHQQLITVKSTSVP